MSAAVREPVESWRRGQAFLKALYETQTFIYPLDQPAFSGAEHWWHFVMPFAEPGALDHGFVRDAATRGAERAIERLQKEQLIVRGLRVDADRVEFVSHGDFNERREVRARLGRAMATAFRRATGRKLNWERCWVACLNTRNEILRGHVHLGLPTSNLEPPPSTGALDYDAFIARLMAS